jgi:hypothetical protein
MLAPSSSSSSGADMPAILPVLARLGLIAGLLLIALRVPLAASRLGGAPTASSPG